MQHRLLENALLLSTSPLPPAPQTDTQPLSREAGNVNLPQPMISKWENATESPTFAINHLHTFKPGQNKAAQSSDTPTPQMQHKSAGRKLDKPFLHPLLCRGAFPSHCASAKLGNREGRGRQRSRVVVWAGHRGRGGTTSMGPADRAEGFMTHTHGGPGAEQATEPDPSPKPSTEPQEAPSSRAIDRGGMGQQPATPSSSF